MGKPDRRRQLRTAAARLFRQIGYDRATVRDIARAVDLQSGSIFYYYATKEDILVDVMNEGMRQFTAAALRPLRDARTVRERLRGLFVGHLKALHSQDSNEVAVVLSEWRNLSPRSRRSVVKLRDRVDAIWDQALREAAAEGLVRGDPRLLRLAMLGAINWSLQWYDSRGELAIEDLADRLLELFLPERH